MDFYEMEIIDNIGIPTLADVKLKKYIIAAAKTFQLRATSIDGILKKYGDNWIFPEDLQFKYKINVLNQVINRIEDLGERILNGKPRPDHVGLFAAEAALARLRSSFISTAQLLSQNYFCEAAAICRIILEQIAWAYNIKKEKDPNRLLKSSTLKSIKCLEGFLPFKIGNIYGELSHLTHLTPKFNSRYLNIQDSRITIKFNDLEETNMVLLIYVILADALCITAEAVSFKYFDNPNNITVKNNHISIKKNRSLNKLAKEIKKMFFTRK